MPPLNLAQLAIGERVQHELLVVDRVEKTQGNGDPFVLLTLGNASGSIGVAPIWSSQREWADGADRGRVVQAIGQVGLPENRQTADPSRRSAAGPPEGAGRSPCVPAAHRRGDDEALGLDRPAPRRDLDAGGFGYTPCGLLLGHVVLGCLMLERRRVAAGRSICSDGQLLDLPHMILSHHGALEFGSPVQPMTAEAEIALGGRGAD